MTGEVFNSSLFLLVFSPLCLTFHNTFDWLKLQKRYFNFISTKEYIFAKNKKYGLYPPSFEIYQDRFCRLALNGHYEQEESQQSLFYS